MITIENYAVLLVIIAALYALLSTETQLLVSVRADFLEFFRNNKWWWIAVGITGLLSYGFTLTNYSVGVDDEAITYYMNGGLLAAGRFGVSHFLRLIFDAFEFLPFWLDALGVIVLVLATVVWSLYFLRMSQGNLPRNYTMVFACLALSYPAIAYLFVFMGSAYSIGFCLLFTGAALILFVSSLSEEAPTVGLPSPKALRRLTAASIILGIAIGIHEWATVLFLSGMFSGLLLEHACGVSQKRSRPTPGFLITGIQIFVVLGCAVAFTVGVTALYQRINGVTPNGYTAHMILWRPSTLLRDIPVFLVSLWRIGLGDFLAGKKIELWLAAFDLAILVDTAVAVMLWIRSRSMLPMIMTMCVVGSGFALNIVTGNASLEVRTFVHLAVQVGFAFMLLTYLVGAPSLQGNKAIPNRLGVSARNGMRTVVLAAVVLLALYQTKEMSRLFYLDYLRYEADARTAYNIISEIEQQAGSLKKPVAFLGPFTESANLWMGDSIFSHDRLGSPYRMVSPGRIIGFMAQLGYNLEPLTSHADLGRALLLSRDMPSYPLKGSVQAFDDFVVVKLGPLPALP